MQKLLTEQEVAAMRKKATTLRRRDLEMLHKAGSGHPGGSLSCMDIVMTLFDRVLKHDPKRPDWPERDRFVISKGHGCPALYVVMADHGYFPDETLDTLRQVGSPLQGHPDTRFLPAVEVCTGSLGQGFSVAVGLAIAGKLDGARYKVYCLLGDGEIDEGQVWEAALVAAHHGLDNLIAIIDRNGVQQCGKTSEIMNTDPVPDKFKAFNWTTYDIDGHDFQQIYWALQPARIVSGHPTMIVARTVKGKGVSFMDSPDWHGKAPNDEELARALAELSE